MIKNLTSTIFGLSFIFMCACDSCSTEDTTDEGDTDIIDTLDTDDTDTVEPIDTGDTGTEEPVDTDVV